MKKVNLIFLVLLAMPPGIAAQKPNTASSWKLDNLKQIGGNSVKITGQPHLITEKGHHGISFDGKGDSILVDRNPIATAAAFTIEAIFRPEAGGEPEQRWL